jgi:hypothetical protein
MSNANTIRVQVFDTRGELVKDVEAYLGKDISCHFQNDIIAFVEVYQVPGIIKRLGTVEGHQDKPWYLAYVSSQGLGIYVCSLEFGDTLILIPWSNVIAIHSVGEEWYKPTDD